MRMYKSIFLVSLMLMNAKTVMKCPHGFILYVGGKTQWFMKQKSRKEKDTFYKLFSLSSKKDK